MPEDQGLTLRVAGQRYGGWKTARVTLSLERCVGDFELSVTELWPGEDYTRRIRPGELCELAIAGEILLTGYVDEVEMRIESGSHEVRIAGRDKAADLVDCSAVRKPGQWRAQPITRIASDLAQPFGVTVRADVDVGKPLAGFALQDGETVFEAIDRAARLRGLLVISDGAGGLVLTRAGLQRAADALVMGGNVLAGRAAFDMRDRYSEYVAKGQAAGNDFFNSAAAAHIKASAADPQVLRHRPLLLTSDSPDAAGSLRDRVKWEASIRRARSTQVELMVQGWHQTDGTLWRHNHLVHVVSDALRLDEDLLISSAEYSISDQGTTTRLTLTLADAFTLQPIKQPAKAGSSQFWDVAEPRR